MPIIVVVDDIHCVIHHTHSDSIKCILLLYSSLIPAGFAATFDVYSYMVCITPAFCQWMSI